MTGKNGTDANVTTSTMQPALSAGSSVDPTTAPAPKRRKRRSSKREEPKAPPTPGPEQFELLGRLTFEAHSRGLELSEYVDLMRSAIESYDAVFGVD